MRRMNHFTISATIALAVHVEPLRATNELMPVVLAARSKPTVFSTRSTSDASKPARIQPMTRIKIAPTSAGRNPRKF
jgi:hypothetical protein